MTITRLWQSGFETNNWQDDFHVRSSGSFAMDTVPKTGTYSLRTWSTDMYGTRQLVGSYTQGRCGFHFRHAGLSTPTQTGGFWTVANSGTVALQLRWNESGNLLKVFGGATELASVSAASVGFQIYNSFRHIGIDFKLHASAGWVRVYVDGNLLIDYAGNTTQGASTYNELRVGAGSSASWNAFCYYDDIYFDETTGESAPAQVPDYRYNMILPTSDASPNAWTPNSGSTHYTQVDEVTQDGDTTYLEVNTTAQEERFGMANMPTLPAGWSVVSVIGLMNGRKVDAGGTIGARFKLRESATTTTGGTTHQFATSYTNVAATERFTSKPSGGAWTEAAVNALEFGLESN